MFFLIVVINSKFFSAANNWVIFMKYGNIILWKITKSLNTKLLKQNYDRKKTKNPENFEYQVIAEFETDTQKINLEKAKEWCDVIGRNTDAKVVAAYNPQ